MTQEKKLNKRIKDIRLVEREEIDYSKVSENHSVYLTTSSKDLKNYVVKNLSADFDIDKESAEEIYAIVLNTLSLTMNKAIKLGKTAISFGSYFKFILAFPKIKLFQDKETKEYLKERLVQYNQNNKKYNKDGYGKRLKT
jgi:hypothetical protein